MRAEERRVDKMKTIISGSNHFIIPKKIVFTAFMVGLGAFFGMYLSEHLHAKRTETFLKKKNDSVKDANTKLVKEKSAYQSIFDELKDHLADWEKGREHQAREGEERVPVDLRRAEGPPRRLGEGARHEPHGAGRARDELPRPGAAAHAGPAGHAGPARGEGVPALGEGGAARVPGGAPDEHRGPRDGDGRLHQRHGDEPAGAQRLAPRRARAAAVLWPAVWLDRRRPRRRVRLRGGGRVGLG